MAEGFQRISESNLRGFQDKRVSLHQKEGNTKSISVRETKPSSAVNFPQNSQREEITKSSVKIETPN